MLAQVKPHEILFLRHPQPHQGLEDREDDHGADKGKDPGRYHRYNLHPELPRVAEEETVVPGRVDSLRSKEAGRQRPPGSANPMHTHHILGDKSCHIRHQLEI